MIDPLPALPSPVAIGPTASAAKAAARAHPARFGQTLASFLDSRAATHDRGAGTPREDDRHDTAADGNALPSKTASADATPPIWMAPPVPPSPLSAPVVIAELAPPADGQLVGGISSPAPTPTPVPPSTAAGSPAQTIADSTGAIVALTPPASTPHTTAAWSSPRTDSQPRPLPALADMPELSGTLAATGAPTNQDARLVLPPLDPAITAALDTALTRAAVARQDAASPAPATADAPQPLELASSGPADAAVIASAVPQPAGRVFAAALATAWRDRAQRSGDPEASAGTMTPGVGAPTHAGDAASVPAAGNAGQSGLDLTRDTGLQRMIEHIETLRDDADARDTRIRLVPDALGSVDVAVRQVGDRVHVHFTAAQEATRALIADAQPRLSELAAARGVRIGDTSVSADSGSGTGAAPQPRPAPSITPAPRALSEETQTPSDARVA